MGIGCGAVAPPCRYVHTRTRACAYTHTHTPLLIKPKSDANIVRGTLHVGAGHTTETAYEGHQDEKHGPSEDIQAMKKLKKSLLCSLKTGTTEGEKFIWREH